MRVRDCSLRVKRLVICFRYQNKFNACWYELFTCGYSTISRGYIVVIVQHRGYSLTHT